MNESEDIFWVNLVYKLINNNNIINIINSFFLIKTYLDLDPFLIS
jgi:hypothetical protein